MSRNNPQGRTECEHHATGMIEAWIDSEGHGGIEFDCDLCGKHITYHEPAQIKSEDGITISIETVEFSSSAYDNAHILP